MMEKVALLVALVWGSANAFYFPEFPGAAFCVDGSPYACPTTITVVVNQLYSRRTLLPMSRLPLCELSANTSLPWTVTEVLAGNSYKQARIKIPFARNNSFEIYCVSEILEEEDFDLLRDLIAGDYSQQWLVGGLPVLWCHRVLTEGLRRECRTRFPVGCYAGWWKDGACERISGYWNIPNAFYLFNHIHLKIGYLRDADVPYMSRIVMAEAELGSCAELPCSYLSNSQGYVLPKELPIEGMEITLSYSVQFVELPGTSWGSRWEGVLATNNHSLGRQSILLCLHSLAVCALLLSSLLCLYSSLPVVKGCSGREGLVGEGGQLQCSSTPLTFRNAAFIVATSNGVQVLSTSFFITVLGCLGLTVPPYRDFFVASVLVTYTLLGVLGGYTAAVLCRSILLKEEAWSFVSHLTSSLLPGLFFSLLLSTNFFLWLKGTGFHVPFRAILFLAVLWLFSHVPLTFYGVEYGAREPMVWLPQLHCTAVSLASSHSKTRRMRRREECVRVCVVLLRSVLPFLCALPMLHYITRALLLGEIFYQYPYALLHLMLLVIACSLQGISYLHLCGSQSSELSDNSWWWDSFCSGSLPSSLCLSVYFFLSYFLQVGLSGSLFVYLSYSAVVCLLFLLTTGATSFLAALFFLKHCSQNLQPLHNLVV